MNLLRDETSPYLLQHADNPVHWRPWNDNALAEARAADKPILLSIGYSACHWCHVMAHESFEDDATAAIMNEHFVNIKVDREERPDLDKIYQTAHQLLTQRGGGWPLTVFLSPQNLTPFFAGTYFPKQPRYGMPAFADLLQRVAQYFRENRDELEEQNDRLRNALDELAQQTMPSDDALSAAPIDVARHQLAKQFDEVDGGFGTAPKFPHPTHLQRLLRYWSASRERGQEDLHAKHMLTHTLTKMAEGGIYDQLGGGFCRYSVDGKWSIPHFEKMLYDNGPLLAIYANAWLATGNPLFKRIASETAEWMLREMRAPEGAFYSTLDADSEGEEGKFYVWQRNEVRDILPAKLYTLVETHFGLDQTPNFEGHWHLRVTQPLESIAQAAGICDNEAVEALDEARALLFGHRAKRTRPERDEKILTAWNALAIHGLAIAGRALDDDQFIAAADKTLQFIRAHLWRDNRLLACFKDGRARFNAYLDDYAFLIDAILALLEARWRDQDCAFAQALADALLDHFEDKDRGGFYFTSHDHETLLQRPKTFSDDALPAGNAVAAFALGRLGHLLGEVRYIDAAERTLLAAWATASDVPLAHTALLDALEEYLAPPQLVFLRGEEEHVNRWANTLRRAFSPRRLLISVLQGGQKLPGACDQQTTKAKITAYRCDGFACSAPLSDLEQFERELLQGTR